MHTGSGVRVRAHSPRQRLDGGQFQRRTSGTGEVCLSHGDGGGRNWGRENLARASEGERGCLKRGVEERLRRGSTPSSAPCLRSDNAEKGRGKVGKKGLTCGPGAEREQRKEKKTSRGCSGWIRAGPGGLPPLHPEKRKEGFPFTKNRGLQDFSRAKKKEIKHIKAFFIMRRIFLIL